LLDMQIIPLYIKYMLLIMINFVFFCSVVFSEISPNNASELLSSPHFINFISYSESKESNDVDSIIFNDNNNNNINNNNNNNNCLFNINLNNIDNYNDKYNNMNMNNNNKI